MLRPPLAALLLVATLGAQPPRFAQVGDPLPDGMGQVIGAADADGDGDRDLYSTVGIFLNNRGFFSPGPTMPPGFVPTTNMFSVAIADVTGDGRADVLVAPGGGFAFPVGPKVFAAPPPGGPSLTFLAGAFTGAAAISKVAVADVDADGDLDVLGASTSSSTPQWSLFLNNGSGNFTLAPAVQWPLSALTGSWVGAGDFDGDGWIDAFITDGVSGASWRRNLGGGTFGPVITIGSPLVADSGTIGDFNGDGFDDVFVVDVTGLEAIHFGAMGGLTAGAASFGGILGPPPVATDLDGDGDADLLRSVVGVSGSGSGELQLRLGGPAGLGAATTVSPIAFQLANPMPYPGVAALDVEGDGDTDLALVTGVGSSALAINGGVNGFVVAPHPIPFGFGALYAPPMDVDGDGDADLLRARLANGVVTLETGRNDGRGQFSDPVPAGSYSGFPGRAIWTDLDGDGDSDLWVATSLTPASGTALLNDGTGVFSAAASVAISNPLSAQTAGDFDGDGDVDIVMGLGPTVSFPPSYNPPILIRSLLAQSGVVSFLPPVTFGVPELITDMEAIDAEPDGDLDLLVGVTTPTLAPSTPRLFLNDGVGGLGTGFPIVGAIASFVATADVTGDGVADAILGNQVWVASASGLSVWSTHAPPIGVLSLADLDLDGILDLVDAAGRWYPGAPGGNFGAPITFVPFQPAPSLSSAPPKLLAIDLDGDGDLDLPLSAIYFNLTRHAGRTSLVSPNSTVSVAVWGPPAAPWQLAISAPNASPQQLPPFGTLFLDPASTAIVGSGTVPPNGRADLSGFLGPAATGLAISWQALVAGQLTNGFDTVILP